MRNHIQQIQYFKIPARPEREIRRRSNDKVENKVFNHDRNLTDFAGRFLLTFVIFA